MKLNFALAVWYDVLLGSKKEGANDEAGLGALMRSKDPLFRRFAADALTALGEKRAAEAKFLAAKARLHALFSPAINAAFSEARK